MLWIAKLGAVAVTAGSFFLTNREEIIKSGDVDSIAIIIVMVLMVGQILGAKVGKLVYWVIAIYLMLYVTA